MFLDFIGRDALMVLYGPTPQSVRCLHQKACCFCHCITHFQEMVEAGQLAYPYSTRELVKLVAHAQRFPHDSLEELASGVFAFDLANRKKRTPLLEVLQRHGIATTEALPGGWKLNMYWKCGRCFRLPKKGSL